MLLCSQPDTIRGSHCAGPRRQHRLQGAALQTSALSQTITPTVADCRYRAPLTPGLCGNFDSTLGYYIPNSFICQIFICFYCKSPAFSHLTLLLTAYLPHRKASKKRTDVLLPEALERSYPLPRDLKSTCLAF